MESHCNIYVAGGIRFEKVYWSRARPSGVWKTADGIEAHIEAAPRVFRRCFDVLPIVNIPAIGQILARSTKVSIISLRRFSTSDMQHADCVADFLRSVLSMPGLRTLDIRWTSLDECFDVFLAGVVASRSLQHLHLDACFLTHSQWLALALALREHPTITDWQQIRHCVRFQARADMKWLHLPRYDLIVRPRDAPGGLLRKWSILLAGLRLSALRAALQRFSVPPITTVGLRMCELEHGTLDFAVQWLQDVRVLDVSHCGFGASDGQICPKKKKNKVTGDVIDDKE